MPSSFFTAIEDLPPITYTPEMTKLLSAASYPNAPVAKSSAALKNREQNPYGGLIVTHDSSEDDDDDGSRPSKRTKSHNTSTFKGNETSQELPKRQRGRPKVSTKDETAAERRRTQIRLAQRAYRNRKENTITELTQKVESLQATMKHLNIGFGRLRESLLNTGLHANSTIARQIDDLMRQLSEAMESPPSDAENPSGEDSDPQPQGFAHDQHQYGMMDGQLAHMTLQGQTHPTNSIPDANIHSISLGFGTGDNVNDFEEQNLTDFQTYPALPTIYPTSSVSKTIQHPLPDLPILPTDTASVSIDRFPNKPSYTYSFQEISFARRLHRFTIEKAFQRLMSPHVDPNWLLKTFRLTFNFTTKERMLKGFKSILERGTDEALENWRAPFIHIGGAGLHFPRYDVDGKPVYPPNLLSPVVAATTWRLPETETFPPANTLEEILESVGFGGEWFDAHDVEEYLKTKGIFPEPHTSFVTVDSALIGSLGSSAVGTITSSSASSPQSQTSGPGWPAQASRVVHNVANNATQLTVQADSPHSLDTSVNAWLGQQEAQFPNEFDLEFEQSPLEVATRETRLLTIEIEKFLERLSDQSVCLGRAPGYRREHVDNALSLAVQEAF